MQQGCPPVRILGGGRGRGEDCRAGRRDLGRALARLQHAGVGVAAGHRREAAPEPVLVEDVVHLQQQAQLFSTGIAVQGSQGASLGGRLASAPGKKRTSSMCSMRVSGRNQKK